MLGKPTQKHNKLNRSYLIL